jgi:hypothetical protein
MSTSSILNGGTNPARAENKEALQKDIDLATLDGFQLPRDITEEFLTRMQKEVDILSLVDTMTLQRLEQDVPQFGVPRLSGSTRDEEGTRTSNSGVDDGQYQFNATDQQYYILVEPKRDALKNTNLNEDEWGELIINEFTNRWANDVGIIGIRAGASDADSDVEAITGGSDLDTTFTGWIARAEGDPADSGGERVGLEDTASGETSSMPVVDNGNAAVDTQLFNDAIQKLDSRYRNGNNVDPVFLMSPDNVQQYFFDLTNREDGLGVAVLQGSSDITPFDYDIIGIPEWPHHYAMLTDPSNLVYGLYEEMELDQTTDTDKVHEERLHSRNWLEGQFDFQIKEMQAGVLVENIADPNA